MDAEWKMYFSRYPMVTTTELDKLNDKTGTMTVPEVVYGNNRLYVINQKANFFMEFAPVDALALSAFAKREELLKSKATPDMTTEKKFNLIDVIPKTIKVKEAEHWKDKDFDKVRDFKQVEIISDWTYTSPYKGSIFYLNS